MTELTDLSDTDASNTAVSGQATEGNVANMGGMDNLFQATLGMLSRFRNANVFRLRDNSDNTKILALDLSGLPTATTTTIVVPPKGGTLATTGGPDLRRNRIVNGDMIVSQQNGTTSGTANGYYPVDQWSQAFVTSAGTLTVAQVASVTPAGSPNRLRATVTVADASLAAGEFWKLSQNLEGSNVADFQYGGSAAKASVLRFGFRASAAGNFAVRFGNSAANRSFVSLFTISAGQINTDTVQTIAIPGDTTGTWLTSDGAIGITLEIVLACGSTFQGTTGWQAGNILGTSGVTNGMASGGAVYELFDVGLKLDPDATGAYGAYEVGQVHAVYRSERYYYRLNYVAGDFVAALQAYGSTSAVGPINQQSAIPMCPATKAVTNSGLANFNLTNAGGITAAVTTTFDLAANGMGGIKVSQADRTGSGLVAGDATTLIANTNAWIAVAARL